MYNCYNNTINLRLLKIINYVVFSDWMFYIS